MFEAEESRLDQKVGALSGFATQLQMETQQARMYEELAGVDVEIVDLATLPDLSIGIPWGSKMIIALVLGLLTGLALAVILEMRNRSIRVPEELERILHVRGLGVIPPVAEAMGTRGNVYVFEIHWWGMRVPGALPKGLVAGSSLVPSIGGGGVPTAVLAASRWVGVPVRERCWSPVSRPGKARLSSPRILR